MELNNVAPSGELAIILSKWLGTLAAKISEIIANNEKPILVAVSRKMPRLMHWVETSFIVPENPSDSQQTDCQKNLENYTQIYECEFASELSLPFLWASERKDNFAFIILDDYLIDGSTIRSVAETIIGLFGKTPYLSTILTNSAAVIPSIVTDIKSSYQAYYKTLKPLIKDICTRIEKSSLPIDLEFPIIHFPLDKIGFALSADDCTKNNSERYKDQYRKAGKLMERFRMASENKWPDVVYPVEETQKNFAIVLTNSPNGGLPYSLNSYVSKIRIFSPTELSDTYREIQDAKGESRGTYKYSGIKIETISPHRIAERMLFEPGERDVLFDNAEYSELWNQIASRLQSKFKDEYKSLLNSQYFPQVEKSIARSLCVMANYLYSAQSEIPVHRFLGKC